ncbi:MAG: methyltransferase domain-containing protein, partial [Saprospiraceae bacterium]
MSLSTKNGRFASLFIKDFMGKKNKLSKFADLLSFPNVLENYDPKFPKLLIARDEEIDLKGTWAEKHFHNDHPIVVELACGRGEYTVSLAEADPDKNFIGVDIKGARIWKGASAALEKNLKNVAFLRTRIEQIALFFGSQ